MAYGLDYQIVICLAPAIKPFLVGKLLHPFQKEYPGINRRISQAMTGILNIQNPLGADYFFNAESVVILGSVNTRFFQNQIEPEKFIFPTSIDV